jgi:glycosyltransferase involved in cell wall biosynthesis
MQARPRVLVFSPSLEGHRAVYTSVLTDVATGAGWDVVIATAATRDHEPSAHLDAYLDRPDVSLIDVSRERERGTDIDPPAFLRLAHTMRSDVTVLTDADWHLRLLSSQIPAPSRRLPGRRVGIFINSTNFIHGAHLSRSPREWASFIRHYPQTWRRDPVLFQRALLPGFRLVDAALCIDEVFVASRGRPYLWLPDIDATLGAHRGDAVTAEALVWRSRLGPFLERNAHRPVFVYFGTPQHRRGYDILLQLALEEGGCFIHAGRAPGETDCPDDCRGFRLALLERSALFETGEYPREFDTAAVFFRAAHHVVLPYREHYGSSGVMLQALRAGRPVLVPDDGLMAHRVRRHGLGAVFRAEDRQDLPRQHAALLRSRVEDFRRPIGRFLEYFSDEQIVAAVRNALGMPGGGEVRLLP